MAHRMRFLKYIDRRKASWYFDQMVGSILHFCYFCDFGQSDFAV